VGRGAWTEGDKGDTASMGQNNLRHRVVKQLRGDKSSLDRDLLPYKSPGIVLIYPTVPCPRGGQVINELVISTSTEFEGWPCLSPVSELHSPETSMDDSCRTGYCFFVSDVTKLNIKVKDSATYTYLLSVDLKPGLNFLSWCSESVLVRGEDRGTTQPKGSNTPEFSLLLCCNRMALTYRLADPADPDSPYLTSPNYKPFAYQLKHHEYPPSLTVLSEGGSVPTLMLLAMVAGGGGSDVREDGWVGNGRIPH
jgi:hypothetical protein